MIKNSNLTNFSIIIIIHYHIQNVIFTGKWLNHLPVPLLSICLSLQTYIPHLLSWMSSQHFSLTLRERLE